MDATLLRRLANPFWFQSFGSVMGMDWHSSGITTSVIGALKRGLTPLRKELGIHVCGGRGKHSRQTPHELVAIGDSVGFDGAVLAKTPHARNINFDWNEPSKVVRVEVDQDRARALGISSQALSQTINAVLSGTTVTQVRDDIYLIDVVARAVNEERAKLETLRSLRVATPGGRAVPLEQVARLSYALE